MYTKKFLTLWIIVFGILFMSGCEKPLPVELFDDSVSEDPVQAEVITQDPEDSYAVNGYDSTGYMPETPKYGVVFLLAKNIITDYTVSGTPVTRENNYGQSIFFDKNAPVINGGGKLIGYKTFGVTYVRMRGIPLARVDFTVKYKMASGLFKDSVLGPRYMIFKPKLGILPFDFDYNQSVDVEVKPVNLPLISFSVITPPPINGTMVYAGNVKNPFYKLEWSKGTGNITVIIGARKKGQLAVVPLYKLTTKDDGLFRVPASFIQSIPTAQFDAVVFTVQRKREYYREESLSQFYVAVQNSYSMAAPL